MGIKDKLPNTKYVYNHPIIEILENYNPMSLDDFNEILNMFASDHPNEMMMWIADNVYAETSVNVESDIDADWDIDYELHWQEEQRNTNSSTG